MVFFACRKVIGFASVHYIGLKKTGSRHFFIYSGLGGKRGAWVRGTGYGVPGYGVRGLVENAGSGGKRGEPFFSPKYEFSSVK